MRAGVDPTSFLTTHGPEHTCGMSLKCLLQYSCGTTFKTGSEGCLRSPRTVHHTLEVKITTFEICKRRTVDPSINSLHDLSNRRLVWSKQNCPSSATGRKKYVWKLPHGTMKYLCSSPPNPKPCNCHLPNPNVLTFCISRTLSRSIALHQINSTCRYLPALTLLELIKAHHSFPQAPHALLGSLYIKGASFSVYDDCKQPAYHPRSQ